MTTQGPSREALAEVLSIFEERACPEEPLTTSEISESLDCSRRATYDRLNQLVDRDYLDTKKVGAKGRVWWLARSSDRQGDGAGATPSEQADRLERRQQELEAELEEVYERVDDAFFALDEGWEFTYVNERAEELLDNPEDELLGRSVWETYSEVVGTAFEENYRRAMAEQEPVQFEAYYPPLSAWFEVSAYPSETGLSVYFRDVIERKRFEETLTSLNTTTYELLGATTDAEIGEHVVDVVSEILDLPGVVVFHHDEDADELRPVETSAEPDFVREDLPALPADESSIAWSAFVDGTTRRFDDIRESPHPHRDFGDTDVQAGVFVPIGDRGVLVAGEREPGAFDEQMQQLLEIVAANAEAAYDRVERESQLEESRQRYRTLVENFPNGMVGLFDRDLRYVVAGGQIFDEIDVDRDDLEGRSLSEALDRETVETMEPHFVAAFDGEERTFDVEYADRIFRMQTIPVLGEDGERLAGMAMSQDVTEQREYERHLEQYQHILETVNDGIYALDDEGRFTLVNAAYVDLTGYDREELLGSHCSLVVDDEVAAEATGVARRIADDGRTAERETVEGEIQRADGSRVPVESNIATPERDGAASQRRIGVVRDLTERKEHEREMETRLQQQAVITELGQWALENPDLDELFEEAVERVAETLDNEYCKVLDLDPGETELLLRAGVGWNDGYVGEATVGTDRASQAGFTLASEEPVIVPDMDSETRFHGPDLLLDHDVKSGVSVVIGSLDAPWGVLGTHDTERRDYTENDANFVQSVANILATAINRREREQQLESQREQLVALDDLNGVVREINGALTRQSTREEIEQVVCERLAASDSYEFAWIGDVDSVSSTVNVRCEAGAESYLDDVTVSVDPDDPTSRGATGRAITTREMQVARNLLDGPNDEAWHASVREYGFRSSVAIPITHEDTLYGVLSVYSSREGAFEHEERTVIGHLGEIVGHTIASVERKRALMGDELVEVEFRIPNVFDVFDVPSTDGRITLDRTVPIGDGVYLEYGTATEDALETLEAMVEAIPHWEELAIIEDGFDEMTFELRLSEPPAISLVASQGGYVKQAVIEDDDYHMTVHLPHGADVQYVVDTVQGAYPTAEALTRRQVTRENMSAGQYQQTLVDELTERQWAVLQAAYFSGFFEWPRESSGQEVAESLGISDATFHQHLRLAQGKLVSTLFSDPAIGIG